MAASKFTPEMRGAIIERLSAGLTLIDTCRALEIKEQTLKTWLTRGRKEDSGTYAEFAFAADNAKAEAAARPEPLTEDEHRRLVAEAARKGSVAALKLAWEMILDDRSPVETTEAKKATDPLAGIDQLAERRSARA